MIKKARPLEIAGWGMKICGCYLLYKFACWQVAAGAALIICGHQVITVQVDKRRREGIPPSIWTFLDD